MMIGARALDTVSPRRVSISDYISRCAGKKQAVTFMTRKFAGLARCVGSDKTFVRCQSHKADCDLHVGGVSASAPTNILPM
jgi:hypothetical protein